MRLVPCPLCLSLPNMGQSPFGILALIRSLPGLNQSAMSSRSWSSFLLTYIFRWVISLHLMSTLSKPLSLQYPLNCHVTYRKVWLLTADHEIKTCLWISTASHTRTLVISEYKNWDLGETSGYIDHVIMDHSPLHRADHMLANLDYHKHQIERYHTIKDGQSSLSTSIMPWEGSSI
jgi:hypothetical protein